MALLDCGHDDVDFIGELLNYDRFDVDVFDVVTKMRDCGYGMAIDSFITCIYLSALYIYHKNRDNGTNEIFNYEELKEFLKKEYAEI